MTGGEIIGPPPAASFKRGTGKEFDLARLSFLPKKICLRALTLNHGRRTSVLRLFSCSEVAFIHKQLLELN
jgi:hypothetical protein